MNHKHSTRRLGRRSILAGLALSIIVARTHAQTGEPQTGTPDAASNQPVGAEAQPTRTVPADSARAEARGSLVVDLDIPAERIEWHMPDMETARPSLEQQRASARQAGDASTVAYCDRMLERMNSLLRQSRVSLSLEEAVRRTLANSYSIQTVSYNPAIETTRIVEAEAAFDAVFFSKLTKDHVDRASASQLSSTAADFTTWGTGVRKLTATGLQLSGQYQLRRTKQSFAFQLINPEYRSDLVLEMRQPILRGFGADFNRSLIVIAKHDRRISDLTFQRQIRDILRQVEELYWRLVQARRDVVITARELAEFEGIYDYLLARKDFDITPVQIEGTRADLELARSDFIRRRATAKNAEDRLIAVMNDPELNLADDIEIVPTDFPHLHRLVVDRLAEVQSALDHRTEIKEQELLVAKAKVAVGRAKNAELPKLDLTFRVTSDGLAGNGDRSFDELSRNNFIEYFIDVDLEVPIGNRSPRAATRRARLQYDQAVAQLRKTFEDMILDVNLAVRQVESTYDQIGPNFESTEAREREVQSLVARAERKDINTLRSELGARRTLAGTRRALVNAMVEYNIAITDLERAKGTLLPFYNVVIPTDFDAQP